MAKNRNKKKRNGVASMEVAESSGVADAPQAMETSESVASASASDALVRKIKGGRPMKRSKNVRKKKAIAKAISKIEKKVEKVLKGENKLSRIQAAKVLYD